MNERDFLAWVRDRWDSQELARVVEEKLSRDQVYLAACLMGEAAEVWDVIKKPFRAGRTRAGELRREERAALLLELGDAYHYLTRLADLYGFSMDNIREGNVQKLVERDEVSRAK